MPCKEKVALIFLLLTCTVATELLVPAFLLDSSESTEPSISLAHLASRPTSSLRASPRTWVKVVEQIGPCFAPLHLLLGEADGEGPFSMGSVFLRVFVGIYPLSMSLTW